MQSVFKFRDLILLMTKKELKIKYKNSILGILWSMLNPLLMLVIYTIAFKYILKVEVENFSLYMFCGLLLWIFFQNSVTQSMASIINNRHLLTKVYFPRLILPLVVVNSNFINLVLNSIILFMAIIFFNVSITWSYLLIPFLVILLYLFVLGFSLILTTLNTRFQDTAHLVEVIFSALFYLTPIIYPLSIVPEHLKLYIMLNPFTSIVECFRSIIIEGKAPDTALFITFIVFSTIILVVGISVFKKYEKYFIDEL